jgi:hypothetical protein
MLKAQTYTLPKAKGVKRIKKMSPSSKVLSEADLNCLPIMWGNYAQIQIVVVTMLDV